MHPSCSACGFRFTRETGYWLGAMYVNYGAAVAVTIALHLVLTDLLLVPTAIQMATLLPFSALFVVAFFRTSRALFLAMDLSWDPEKPSDYPGGVQGRGPAS